MSETIKRDKKRWGVWDNFNQRWVHTEQTQEYAEQCASELNWYGGTREDAERYEAKEWRAER